MKVAVVAPYPRTRQAHGEEGLGGVASYTKNLVDGLKLDARVLVVAPTDGPAGERDDGPVRIVDVPREGARVARAVAALADDPRADVVHVQFEQHLFGGMAQNLLLASALRRLRRAKRVVATLHQVPDLDAVDRKFLKENGFPPLPVLARAWMRFQYRRFATGCHRLVVHEAVMADRLVRQYGLPRGKIVVIPHGIETRTPIAQEAAKARLGVSGKTVVFYFGYVTGYKGVDLLTEALERLAPSRGEDLHVIIAGKVPDRKLSHAAFRENVENLESRIAALSPWVERKGFLSEEEIALHLSAADVVLFPYRQVFGASGPLSLAVGYGRPFLASDAFRGMVPAEDALFARTPEALLAKLDAFLSDPDFRDGLRATAGRLRAEAAWPAVASRTHACYASLTGGASL